MMILTDVDLFQTLQIPVPSDRQVAHPPRLPPAEPPEGQPQPQQGEELQQGAEESQEDRPGEVFLQEQLCSKLQVKYLDWCSVVQ